MNEQPGVAGVKYDQRKGEARWAVTSRGDVSPRLVVKVKVVDLSGQAPHHCLATKDDQTVDGFHVHPTMSKSQRRPSHRGELGPVSPLQAIFPKIARYPPRKSAAVDVEILAD